MSRLGVVRYVGANYGRQGTVRLGGVGNRKVCCVVAGCGIVRQEWFVPLGRVGAWCVLVRQACNG